MNRWSSLEIHRLSPRFGRESRHGAPTGTVVADFARTVRTITGTTTRDRVEGPRMEVRRKASVRRTPDRYLTSGVRRYYRLIMLSSNRAAVARGRVRRWGAGASALVLPVPE